MVNVPIKSRLRGDPNDPMGSLGRQSLRAFITTQAAVTDVFASCVSCLHFDEAGMFCHKYQLKPPATIIANSCIVGYEDRDEIPF